MNKTWCVARSKEHLMLVFRVSFMLNFKWYWSIIGIEVGGATLYFCITHDFAWDTSDVTSENFLHQRPRWAIKEYSIYQDPHHLSYFVRNFTRIYYALCIVMDMLYFTPAREANMDILFVQGSSGFLFLLWTLVTSQQIHD